MSYELLIGDCRETLRTLSDNSVNCCVTSPPYFGLRDYGHDGQLGMEPTPEEFVATLVAVFREVRRVLRDDGTVWLNLGDSYHGGGSTTMNGQNTRLYEAKSTLQSRHSDGSCARRPKPRGYDGYRPKDLIGIPWRVALALQEDGWYIRQDIIWHKPNPMPESVRDRCTKAHEYVFLLSKSPKYYYDHEAAKEPVAESSGARLAQDIANQTGTTRANGGRKTNGNLKAVGGHNGKRNRRSVWTVTTQPYRGAHFATFPPALIEPCILAGCPEGGTVLDPFGGSGTTAGVAMRHGRKAILCEINPKYAELVPDRIDRIFEHYGFDPDSEEQMDLLEESE